MAGANLRVLTPADTQDLTTLDTLKDELGITDSSQDTRLQRWISDSSAQIADYCNRVFGWELVEETFQTARLERHSEELRLSRWPVTEVDSVMVDGMALTTDDWEVDDRTGALYRLADGHRIRWHGRTIVVTYGGGYHLLGDFPRSLEQATLVIMRQRRAAVIRDPSVRSENVPGVYEVSYFNPVSGSSTSDDGAMPPEAASLLDRHRDIPM